MSDVIPVNVRQFIFDYIDTIAQLEGLLIFCNNKELKLQTIEIAHRLYLNEQDTTILINHLCENGFLKKIDNAYQYYPKTIELQNMVDLVADIYARYLVPLTNLIHNKNKVQQFADAFRIRKD